LRAWGIDGCRAGWLAVSIDAAGKRNFTIVERIAQLAALDDATVFIDIPIGLPDSGYRGCDLAARRLLKGAQSRVFLGLRRPLLDYLNDYKAANAWAKRDGKGLAKQAFNILPKIAEIDALMSPQKQRRFRESHPELVFRCLNGGVTLPSKHRAEGVAARRSLLAAHGFGELTPWLAALRGRNAKPDDLFDACALAIAAQEATEGRAQRVEGPVARDSKGLRMEIWF